MHYLHCEGALQIQHQQMGQLKVHVLALNFCSLRRFGKFFFQLNYTAAATTSLSEKPMGAMYFQGLAQETHL